MEKETRLRLVEWQRIHLLEGLIEMSPESLSLGSWKFVQNDSKELPQVFFRDDINLPRYQVIGGGWGMYTGHIEKDENENVRKNSSVSPLHKKTINGTEFMVVECDREPDLPILERDLQYADPY